LTAALELKPKRVVFPIAGKGGVGKTTVMATLAEWYASTAYTADLFDMDTHTWPRWSGTLCFRTGHAGDGVRSA
jgi:signal recognition particle GTPase